MKLNFNLDSDHLDHGTMSTIDEAVVEDIVSAAKRQSVKTLLSGDNITSYSWKIAVEANVTIPFPAGLTEENWMSKLSEESKKHLADSILPVSRLQSSRHSGLGKSSKWKLVVVTPVLIAIRSLTN
jgi:hypothetical protein